ncbi:MAG: NADPH-dependent F420 reductase [Pirellulaceae bacterium]|nr:MAG: NADPH-dependent F420 reductase [Pirellulaceae bacterium]
MRIAILGTGRVGRTLGLRWVQAGEGVLFGSRSPQQARFDEPWAQSVPALPYTEAIAQADVVLLAVPYQAALQIAEAHRDMLAGRVVIDCTNPLNANFTGLEVGFTTSAAEQIAARAPRARLVKAFNTVSTATMADPVYEGRSAALFYCGDDLPAKQCVAQLAERLGFAPVDAGPLANARLLEPLAMLAIYLSCHGWGSQCAWQLVTRAGATDSSNCSHSGKEHP